jgi:hypothetical protein
VIGGVSGFMTAAVPVDTHVWQLTRDRYLPALRGKSLTAAGYSQVLGF